MFRPSRLPALGFILLLAAVAAPPAHGQLAITVFSANIGVLAKLSLSTTTLTFPEADPDTTPQISGVPGPVTVTAKARTSSGSTIRLTVQASDNLRSGVNTINADALTWTATGTGFVSGTVSRTTPQTVGTWTGSGSRTGTQDYRFRNLWTYPSGTYTLTLVYTMTAP